MENVTPAPTAAPVSTSRPRRHLFWKILGISALVWVIAVAMLAIEAVSLTRQAGKLRHEMLAALDLPAHAQVQLTIGPGALAAARTALHFIPDAPPEAVDAVKAVRAASVGVYQLGSAATPAARQKLFAAAEHALGRHGWTRLVGVNNANETVVIYAPSADDDSAIQHMCVAVCNAQQLVIVEGEIDGDCLLTLAARFHPGGLHSPLVKL